MPARKRRTNTIGLELDLISRSTCKVDAFATHDGYGRIEITLTGPAACFPSTSNGREIAFKRGGRYGSSTPFLRRSSSTHARLNAITRLFNDACGPGRSFHDTPVHVLCLLAKPGVRFDSHNYAKPIGDWLQAVGLIDDDTRAEIFCVKAHEYPELKIPPHTTKIIISERSAVEQITNGYILRLIYV
jgi:hypothetical protein